MRILINTLRHILSHPLSDSPKWKWGALRRYARWQISSRIALGPSLVPLVNGTHLIVTSGMTGATGNIYTGLDEFSDCAFLLHLLRPADMFVDVGANVGVYTVLASGVVGACTVSIEPIPQTFARLSANLRVNDITHRVRSCNIGLGRTPGTLRFTKDIDTCNHVVTDSGFDGPTVEVSVRTLDETLGDESPTLIKLDVEGWESEVLAGAPVTLQRAALLGLIVEMNSRGTRLSPNEQAIHNCLTQCGFAAFTYAPLKRVLIPLESKNFGGSNTLYLRNVESVKERLATAEPFSVNGRAV